MQTDTESSGSVARPSISDLKRPERRYTRIEIAWGIFLMVVLCLACVNLLVQYQKTCLTPPAQSVANHCTLVELYPSTKR